MRKGIVVAVAGLALLAGCDQGDKTTNVPVQPKWKGEPYRLALDTKPVKPAATGVTLPGVKFTANPDALEGRATLVIRFDAAELRQRLVRHVGQILWLRPGHRRGGLDDQDRIAQAVGE